MCPQYLKNKSEASRRMNEWAVRMEGCPKELGVVNRTHERLIPRVASGWRRDA